MATKATKEAQPHTRPGANSQETMDTPFAKPTKPQTKVMVPKSRSSGALCQLRTPGGIVRSKTSVMSPENGMKRSRTVPYSPVTSVISSDYSDASSHHAKARSRRSVREISRAFSISFLSAVSSTHDANATERLLPKTPELRERYPTLITEPYNMEMPNSAVHALILVHNAANMELNDLVSYVVPLCERSSKLSPTELDTAITAMSVWWRDFVLFSDLVAHCQSTCAERLYVRFVDEEIAYVGRSETQSIERARARLYERTGVSRELVMKAVSDCIEAGLKSPNERGFRQVAQAANMAVAYLQETCQLSTTFVTTAEKSFRRSKVTGLVLFMLRKLKEYDARERAVVTIMLVRGMEREVARDWVYKYLGFRALRRLNEWQCVHALQRASVLQSIVGLATNHDKQ